MAQVNNSIQEDINVKMEAMFHQDGIDYGLISLNNIAGEPHQIIVFQANGTDTVMEITYNHIRNVLGRKSQPLSIAVAFTVAYIMVFLTGVLGSFSICVVMHRNRYMRTNLNIFLLNLAVVDMINLLIGKTNH